MYVVLLPDIPSVFMRWWFMAQLWDTPPPLGRFSRFVNTCDKGAKRNSEEMKSCCCAGRTPKATTLSPVSINLGLALASHWVALMFHYFKFSAFKNVCWKSQKHGNLSFLAASQERSPISYKKLQSTLVASKRDGRTYESSNPAGAWGYSTVQCCF